MEADVSAAQSAWKHFILEIGSRYRKDDDYRLYTTHGIGSLYAFDTHSVIFKPTLATKPSFRNSKAGAVSYFIGESASDVHQDAFALMPWRDIRFDNQCVYVYDGVILAAGQYHFTHEQRGLISADYTFGYLSLKDTLKIILHHSSLTVT